MAKKRTATPAKGRANDSKAQPPSQVLVTLVRVGTTPLSPTLQHVFTLQTGTPWEYREEQGMGDFIYGRLYYDNPRWEMEIIDGLYGYLVFRIDPNNGEDPLGAYGTWDGTNGPDQSIDDAEVTSYA